MRYLNISLYFSEKLNCKIFLIGSYLISKSFSARNTCKMISFTWFAIETILSNLLIKFVTWNALPKLHLFIRSRSHIKIMQLCNTDFKVLFNPSIFHFLWGIVIHRIRLLIVGSHISLKPSFQWRISIAVLHIVEGVFKQTWNIFLYLQWSFDPNPA
jgi:hypothetical protein